jgi:hypothetical protein
MSDNQLGGHMGMDERHFHSCKVSMSKKAYDKNYICNPSTGRWVKKAGRAGMSVLRGLEDLPELYDCDYGHDNDHKHGHGHRDGHGHGHRDGDEHGHRDGHENEDRQENGMSSSDLIDILLLRTQDLKKYQSKDFKLILTSDPKTGKYSVTAEKPGTKNINPIVVALGNLRDAGKIQRGGKNQFGGSSEEDLENQLDRSLQKILSNEKDKVTLGTVFPRLKGSQQLLLIDEEFAEKLSTIVNENGIEIGPLGDLDRPKKGQFYGLSFGVYINGNWRYDIHGIDRPPTMGWDLYRRLLSQAHNFAIPS